jgi:hypothetical protein
MLPFSRVASFLPQYFLPMHQKTCAIKMSHLMIHKKPDANEFYSIGIINGASIF